MGVERVLWPAEAGIVPVVALPEELPAEEAGGEAPFEFEGPSGAAALVVGTETSLPVADTLEAAEVFALGLEVLVDFVLLSSAQASRLTKDLAAARFPEAALARC